VKDFSAAEEGIIRKLAAQIAGNLLAAAAAVVTVVTLIVMATSAGSRNWVKHDPYWVFTGLIIAIVVILVLLNIMRYMRTQLRLLRPSGQPGATDQDGRAIAAVLTRIPPLGELVTWLRTDFRPSPIPRARLDALKQAHQYLAGEPSGFGDPEAAAGYLQVRDTTATLIEKLERWTSLEAGNAERIIPVEWEQGPKHARAVAEIQGARDGFIRAYDALRRTCRERGIEPS
jgi:hypothetical protein